MSRQGTSRSPSPAVGSSTLMILPCGKDSRQRTMRSARAGGVRTKAEVARLASVPCGITEHNPFYGKSESGVRKTAQRKAFHLAHAEPGLGIGKQGEMP